jgi:hypothetical protein
VRVCPTLQPGLPELCRAGDSPIVPRAHRMPAQALLGLAANAEFGNRVIAHGLVSLFIYFWQYWSLNSGCHTC